MNTKLFPILFVVVALAGCSNMAPQTNNPKLGPIGNFTLNDAQNASKIAKTENTPQSLRRAQCYDYIADQILAAANSVFTPGFLTLNEEKYVANNSATSFGEACGGVLPLALALP